MVNPNRFYTYAYLREDRTPYYIGKGVGKRINEKYNRCAKKPKDKSKIIFLKQNLTEEEAFKHEIYMIAVLGRKDLGTGILRNLTNGGEGCSGMVCSEKTKRKISEGNKGRIMSDENRKRISNLMKEKDRTPHTEETKTKMSKSHIGLIFTDEHRKNLSKSAKKRKHTEETKEKMRKQRIGLKWWNNGQINKRTVECPGKDWNPGFIMYKNKERDQNGL
jgi:hypothetical protein